VEEIGLIRALEAIPGVSGAGFANQLPLAGCCMSTTIYPEGRDSSLDVSARVSFLPVSPTYFQTMRIPLRAGRLLTYQDRPKDGMLGVINYAAARFYWPDRDPVGAVGHFGSQTGTRFQVIGVVGDVRNNGLANATVPEVYLLGPLVAFNPVNFVVRSTRPAESLLPDIRRAIRGVDPLAPIHDVATMDEIAEKSLTLERASSFMMTFFAAAALLMASLGVYGVVSYSVRQRTVELGTRMALGAVGSDVVKLVVGGGLQMAALGCLLGAAVVLAVASRLSQWFEITDLRVLPLLASLAIAGGIALAASFFPAWRATFLAPASAIRNIPEPLWHSVRQRVREARAARSGPADTGTFQRAEATLLTEFVDAARRAGSFAEALQISLATLCARLDAESALLLERDAHGVCRPVAAFPLDRSAECAIPAQGFLLNRLKFYDFALPLSSGDFETWLRWAAEHRPQHLAEIESLRDAGARIAVALRTRTEMLGVLLLGPPADRETYTAGEKRLFRNCAEQFALMIENARLTDRVVEQEKLRRDVALAAEVQKRLMPEQPPALGIASLAAMSLPARTVGGDYYDFLDLGERRVGIALADVAGKGVAAALIMSVVQASLRILSSDADATLPQIVAKLNRFLHRSTSSNSYATFFYAQADDSNRQLRYVNAGHNPPYLFRASGEIEELSIGGAVIGMFPQLPYQEGRVDLRPGDVLIAFTDGVSEAMSPGEEEFSEERLKDLVRGLIQLSPQEISARVAQALRDWMQDAPQHDDLTLVVMKVS
jgi:serine phosphatase RsbU (regulator of sigma subunit)